jgi:hypothetical protein
MQGGTTFAFVTDGIEAALEQARAAAGDRDVQIGGGVRLFDAVSSGPAGLERTRVAESPTGVVHLSYRPAQL